jgi:transcriptional/translational regulatory protein YebC/TACO1
MYFNKYGGSLGTTGMTDFLFDRKCSFKVAMKEGIDIEELELEMIDAGLDEIFVDEGEIMIYADFQNFGPIQKYLEDNKFEIKTFAFERIPNDTKELNPEQQADVEKLLEKMEEDDDVINVFHNMR